jgi:DNA-binding winged helix-turn-helix (wHTH) protein/tetratricopeptide (TPR) repeat protein
LGTSEPQSRAGELGVGRRWAFGPAVLDERSLELIVNGAVVRIERKPLEVLLYLLHHAGEVVTKEELAENLWPGRILTETVLTRCVSQIRQVLQDDDRALIRTVHGFGYRLVADVRVDAAVSAPLPAFDFKPGDHPPQRPQWRLVERLGAGGHGEAWLARHDKTGDRRVFKFALDAGALRSLKREITLYRVLHDALEERAAVVPILEWNLEEPPYFIETEFVEGRDLSVWAESRGGLGSVPLERRLELVAQIAEALGAAHSVGVLHKDLKPGNVLIKEDAAGVPRIRLADFGSGGVLDTGKLDALGITNLGFTGTASINQGISATPLYLAPEVIAGQPFTVAADVYALGVMLYQLVVGDLRRPLAPGWEVNVEDILLREDIAAAAAGDPSRRLAEAAQLSTRLRTLAQRHEARVAEEAAREKAARTQRIMQELKRTQAFAAAVLVLAVAAMVGGVSAYRARNDAVEARATTLAINDFLTEGVLRVDPAAEKPKHASYESLLERAASQVDSRFSAQPQAAASIHWLLGRRFHEVGHVDEARVQYEKAASLLPTLEGRASIPALLSLDRLIPIYVERGHLAEGQVFSEKLLRGWRREVDESELSTLLLRTRMARFYSQAGELRKADAEFRLILTKLPEATPPSEETKALLKEFLGWALAADISALTSNTEITEATKAYITSMYAGYLGDFADDYLQATAMYREALPTVSRLLGNDSEITAVTYMSLGLGLALLGHHEEADGYVARAEQILDISLPAKHWLRVPPRFVRGRLELERLEPARAIAALNSALSMCSEGCAPRLAEEIRYELARALDQLGESERAIDAFRQTIRAFDMLRGPNHVGSLRRRLSLADALMRRSRPVGATAVLSQIDPAALGALPPPHLVVAEHNRIIGMLRLGEEPEKAYKLLEESLRIFEQRLGSNHVRAERLRIDLALARQRRTINLRARRKD